MEKMRQSRTSLWLQSLLLFAVNALFVRALFVTEYTRHMGSIEGAYIGLSRWILQHPFDVGWFPLWYGGIPLQNAYPPLLHVLVAVVAGLLGISPALSHHAVSAVFFCLGPVTLFWCAAAIGASRPAAFLGALLYSLASPALLLTPGMRRWVRLENLVQYGEGPHTAALALLPLAVLTVHWSLERPGPARTLLAALAVAAVPLTNWIGAFALTLMLAAYLLARAVEAAWPALAMRAAAIGALAYALAASWIPPSTLGAIARNAQYVEGNFQTTSRQLVYAASIALGAAALLVAMRRAGLLLRFAALFVFFAGALVLAHAWLGVAIIPQPWRYLPELELALAFAACWLFSRLRPLPRLLAFAGLAFAMSLNPVSYFKRAAELIQPIEIQQTVEYRAANFLKQSGRAYLSGSAQFWATAFSDVPLVGGGFDQGRINPVNAALDFAIPYTLADGPRTALWLRLLGADSVYVSGPQSPDAYRQEWRDPRKFEGVLEEIWRDRDTYIYQVPTNRTLAHAIRREHVVPRAPVNVEDVAPVLPLAQALEAALDRPPLRFEWLSPSRARVTGQVAAGELIFLQVNYHPGWRAASVGRDLPIQRDGLGFMVLDPGCSGPCQVSLRFDGGAEMLAARAARWAALALVAAWWMVQRRRRSPVR
jgi:hypothetical protein